MKIALLTIALLALATPTVAADLVTPSTAEATGHMSALSVFCQFDLTRLGLALEQKSIHAEPDAFTAGFHSTQMMISEAALVQPLETVCETVATALRGDAEVALLIVVD